MTNEEWYDTDLGKLGGNIFAIGEISDSYVVFEYYHDDPEECAIYRLSKQLYDYDKVKNSVINAMVEHFEYTEAPTINKEYVELPLPIGSIKF